MSNSVQISAIVPARNEQESIANCVESLAAQLEIDEIVVVDDQSIDRTAEIVMELARKFPKVRLLETSELPRGWVGKNYAVWSGAREAHGEWLLFTDADAVHEADSARKAIQIAKQLKAALVSFSPEQVMKTWFEKSLIPYVYCRLSRHFSYDDVNNPGKEAAAANGQFLMIRRDAYEAAGGHAKVAAEVLEDVALARHVKRAGYRLWFGSGKGIVRVRMYRTFGAMWQGWKKNLYSLVGARRPAVVREIAGATAPIFVMLLAAVASWYLTRSALGILAVIASGIAVISIIDARELTNNGYAPGLTAFVVPGRLLYAGVLWASCRSYARGKLEWKGREYPVGGVDASNG